MHEDLVTSPTVISADPGGTTGWSIIVVHPESLVADDVSVLENIEHHTHGQIRSEGVEDGEWKTVDYLLSLAHSWPGSAFMIEDFVNRKGQGGGKEIFSPVRITAAFEFAVFSDPDLIVQLPKKQLPALAKSTATDDRMKRWGLYNKAGGQNHARDADRHGITFLRRAKKDAVLRYAAWPHLFTLNGELR